MKYKVHNINVPDICSDNESMMYVVDQASSFIFCAKCQNHDLVINCVSKTWC